MARSERVEIAKRGHDRGRSGADRFQKEAICAGLHPAGVLVYAKRVHGRANRPFGNGSTVAPIVTAP